MLGLNGFGYASLKLNETGIDVSMYPSALAAIIGLFFLRSVKVDEQEASFLEENKEVAQFN